MTRCSRVHFWDWRQNHGHASPSTRLDWLTRWHASQDRNWLGGAEEGRATVVAGGAGVWGGGGGGGQTVSSKNGSVSAKSPRFTSHHFPQVRHGVAQRSYLSIADKSLRRAAGNLNIRHVCYTAAAPTPLSLSPRLEAARPAPQCKASTFLFLLFPRSACQDWSQTEVAQRPLSQWTITHPSMSVPPTDPSLSERCCCCVRQGHPSM